MQTRLRGLLAGLAAALDTDQADPFLKTHMSQLRELLGVTVRSRIQAYAHQIGHPLTGPDAVELAVTSLIAFPDVLRRAAGKDAPGWYLGEYTKDWVRAYTGRARQVDAHGRRVPVLEVPLDEYAPDSVAYAGTTLEWDPDAEPALPEHAARSLREATHLTWEVLAGRTPTRYQAGAAEVLAWAALCPPREDHSRWQLDLADAVHTLTDTGLDPARIEAVLHITWGTRPDPAATSLLGGYLRKDPTHGTGFDPYSSATHRRAIRSYQQRMLTAA